jgi:sugar lactone lactonase YvrE
MTSPTTWRPARRFCGRGSGADQFSEALRGIAVDGQGHIHAVGDSTVKVFTGEGKLLRRWPTSLPGHAIAVSDDGRVWVGQSQQVEIYDAQGTLVDTWRIPDLGLVTAIDHRDGDVFLADAGVRWIRHLDGEGRLLNNIGDQHRKGGFHIPNGVVDFDIDAQGILHVANPGMHRVERYRANGELLGHFGRFDGRDPQGFPGCCNPTNVTLDDDGRVIVTEKAGPRVKVYDPDGTLLSVVADDGFEPAAKNMDVQVDAEGRIYVVDTVSLAIIVFAPADRKAAL